MATVEADQVQEDVDEAAAANEPQHRLPTFERHSFANLVINFAGEIKLEQGYEPHDAILAQLRLGKTLRLEMTGQVTGRRHNLRTKRGAPDNVSGYTLTLSDVSPVDVSE